MGVGVGGVRVASAVRRDPAGSHCDDKQGVFFSRLVRLIPAGCDQALRKPRITSALFVCCRRRNPSSDTLKGIFQSRLPEDRGNKQNVEPPLPIEYRFFVTCPLCWRIQPRKCTTGEPTSQFSTLFNSIEHNGAPLRCVLRIWRL